MPNERRQFRILYRDFLVRIVDLEDGKLSDLA